MTEIENIKQKIEFITTFYKKLINILPSFSIVDNDLLPYGLKPHTRSISWIVEQVITQQSKKNAQILGVKDVDFNVSDTSLHDCVVIDENSNKYYVNIKAHNADGKENKNDIAAVEKIYTEYINNDQYDLIYACFGIHFNNVTISFDKNYLEVFSAQYLPIYVNPRNDKIQALYKHTPQIRTRKGFITLLEKSSKSIKLQPKKKESH